MAQLRADLGQASVERERYAWGWFRSETPPPGPPVLIELDLRQPLYGRTDFLRLVTDSGEPDIDLVATPEMARLSGLRVEWDGKPVMLYTTRSNDVSLLLRLELLGVDIGDRWRVLAEKAGSRTEDRILTFIDCHVVAALAAAGQVDKAERMVEEMASAGGVFADVGATVSKALIAHRVGNYPAAARLLGDVRDTIVTIGGSHAQRNLFELFFEDAGDRRA